MRRTGVTQATRGKPSTHTVQHPHCPCGLQPSLTERQPSSSRSASRREIAVVDDDRVAVQGEGDRCGRAGSAHRAGGVVGCGAGAAQGAGCQRAGAQLKEEPQPQVRVALGLVMWKPAPCSPSL